MDTLARSERKLYGVALIVAPLLLTLATFFWQGNTIGSVGGMLQVYAYVFWIPAILGLLSLLRPTMPTFSVWGTLSACLVCVAGSNFGMQGVYEAAFMQTRIDAVSLAAWDNALALPSMLVLNMPGLLFPLTLIVISYFLWRNRAVPPLLALLLCLGAVAFPASRIPRIELIAHLADLLLLVAAGGIGWLFLQGQTKAQSLPRAVGFGDD